MKYLPHGTQVSIGGTSIGGLIAVGIPERTRGEAETTDTDSGGDREWFPAIREAGSVELTMRHDPDDAGQTALEDNYDADGADAIEEVIITLPDDATSASGGRTMTFDGFVTAPPQGELGLVDDEVAEQTSTIKIDGAVAIA